MWESKTDAFGILAMLRCILAYTGSHLALAGNAPSFADEQKGILARTKLQGTYGVGWAFYPGVQEAQQR